jgi:DNA replication protein DnaC
MQKLEVERDKNGHPVMTNGKVQTEFKQTTGFFETQRVVYQCPKHGEVVCNIMKVNGMAVPAYCPKCEEEREKDEQIKAQAEQLRRERYNSYKERNIEPEYWEKELKDFVPETPEQKKALEAVQALIAAKSGKVVLLGNNGVGKTFLGCMAVKALGGKILSMYEITTMIRQCYSSRAEMTELEFVEKLANLPLLVIDEMGRTKGSEAELMWLSYILDKRHTRNLPFMILSNTHLARDCPKKGCDSCFERFVNNDVLSRLRQNSKIITIKAPDYRAKQRG